MKKSPQYIPALEKFLIFLLCCFSFLSCAKSDKARSAKDDLAIYRRSDNQLAHETVKTERFIVPVGSVISIKELELEPGITNLTATQEKILYQVFYSIEEITEDTNGDTNKARVADFKKMQFEIRSYPEKSGNRVVAQEQADTVFHFLTGLGTPTWRLHAKGFAKPASESDKRGKIVFARIE